MNHLDGPPSGRFFFADAGVYLMRTPFCLALVVFLLLAAARPAAARPVLAGRFYTELYAGDPIVAPDSSRKLTLGQMGMQLYGRELLGGRGGTALDGFVSLRGRYNFANTSGFDPEWRLFQGYLQLRHGHRGVLRAGRMFLQGAVGARLGDGVYGAWKASPTVKLDGFFSASVDPLEPQDIRNLDEGMWSGARVHIRRSFWYVAPAVLWDKRAGVWRRKLIGLDADVRSQRHSVTARYYYNAHHRRTDEARVAYTYSSGHTWRAALRYQYRDPRVTFFEYTVDSDSSLITNGRNFTSAYVTVALSAATRLTADAAVVFADHTHTRRYGAMLTVPGLYVRYDRRDGHGPVLDRITAGGRWWLSRGLRTGASLGVSQYRLDPALSDEDRTATFATAELTWLPTGHWAWTVEGQALGNYMADYDVRLFSRLEYSIGAGL